MHLFTPMGVSEALLSRMASRQGKTRFAFAMRFNATINLTTNRSSVPTDSAIGNSLSPINDGVDTVVAFFGEVADTSAEILVD